MNSKIKQKNTATTQGVQPKLRFPEFQDIGDWTSGSLGSLYTFITTNCFSRDKLNYKKGMVRNIHYGDIHKKFSALFDVEKETTPFINESENIDKFKEDSFCIKGDIIFADASENIDDVGKSIEIVNLNNEKLLAGLHTLLARQKGKKLIVSFGGYLFQSNMIRDQIKKQAQGTKVFGISAGRLATIEICYPLEKEQQQIADCLSSIDELITSESKKLDILKTYKKGLMQQLFPAEGENLPELRFSECKDNWIKMRLGQLGQFIGGGTPSKATPEYWQGNIPWISSSDIFEDDIRTIKISKYINNKAIINSATKKVPKGSILFVSRVGTGKLAINELEICTSQDFISFFSTTINKYYLAYYFQAKKSKLIRLTQGTSIKGFSKIDLESLEINFPKIQEQEKIADCLYSLDELIAAKRMKLDNLKDHKKGLMQQLFPTASELQG